MILYSLTQLDDDLAAWNKLEPKDGIIRRGYLRFGQYVWNKYEWTQPWPELFYETHPAKAYAMLQTYIIDLGGI